MHGPVSRRCRFSAARDDCLNTARPGIQSGADRAAPPATPPSRQSGPLGSSLPLATASAPQTSTIVPTAIPMNSRLSGMPS